MAIATGTTLLPDVGELSYNGIEFNCLYTSRVRGEIIQDAAKRTTKYTKYTISVDGVVTLKDDANDINNTWYEIRRKLSEHGKRLYYKDKGFGPFKVNSADIGSVRDVNWGPIPKIIEFMPLGGSRSAKIVWQIEVHLPEHMRIARMSRDEDSVLQFNYETNLEYLEDGYSKLNIKGILEIPKTRNLDNRRVDKNVDNFRQFWLNKLADQFDLKKYRVVDRTLNISRDKRILEWAFSLEELSPYAPPLGLLITHGRYTVKPKKEAAHIQGSVQWVCNLRVTYNVPKHLPRNIAWYHFVILVMHRMKFAHLFATGPNIALPQGGGGGNIGLAGIGLFGAVGFQIAALGLLGQLGRPAPVPPPQNRTKAWLFHLSFEEGLYLDSKTNTFEASWIMITTYQTFLLASGWSQYPEIGNMIVGGGGVGGLGGGPGGGGLWGQIPQAVGNAIGMGINVLFGGGGGQGGPIINPAINTYDQSVRPISGATSWLKNQLNPQVDYIVDFGDSTAPDPAKKLLLPE